MRAVVVQPGGTLGVETLPDPTPGEGEVVLRVSTCGICGTDLHLHGAGLLPDGTVMGHEFCGEVMESKGALRAGDRVCALPMLTCGQCERCRSGLGAFCTGQRTLGLGDAHGAFAEFVAVSVHETVRLPSGVSDDQGALVEPLAVGLHALNAGRPPRGEPCLVLGGGPIGLAIALWAAHFGADPVVVSEPAAGRRALAETLGVGRVVDPTTEDLPGVLSGLGSEGPAVVYEATGVAGLLEEAVGHVRFRGRIVVAGLCLAPERIPSLPAMQKEASLHYVLAYEKDDFQYTVDMIEQGRIDPMPMLQGTVGLEGVAGAFADLSGPDAPCKLLVRPGA